MSTEPTPRSQTAANEPLISHRTRRSLAWASLAFLIVVLGVFLPPLLNISRYQARVARAISASIGRPVHFDRISLHLLPLPGLTIQNFVVQEDPAFGPEPAMRANVVEARVRLLSLWSRRIEVSRIDLKAPSINLVRRADGYWSLQGVVTQAGQLQSAPTAQAGAGSVPRFPYIEATDARVNIKSGEDKLPWSLVDAKFSLWLPDPSEWRVRVSGRPLRTDTDVSDVGELQVEASLGRGPGGAANQPLHLHATWDSTPLGEAAKLVVANDPGWRGAASAELDIGGTAAAMILKSDLHLHNVRRAAFVPHLPMSVDAHCEAEAMGVLHQLRHVRCAIPTAQSTGLLDAVSVFRSHDDRLLDAPDVLTLQADVPDVQTPATGTATVSLERGSPQWVVDWMRVFSSRMNAELKVDGTVNVRALWNPATQSWAVQGGCDCELPAPPLAALPDDGKAPAGSAIAVQRWAVSAMGVLPALAENGALAVVAAPSPGPAGSAAATETVHEGNASIRGQVSRSGYTLQYLSDALARYAASLVPALGDDLPADLAGPLQAERAWGATQQWTAAAAPAADAPSARKKRSRHH